MSLTDALLLESWPHNANAAALFPCNYWIAQRGDGLFGSGASGDPWDGSGSRFDARMKDIQTRMEQMQIGQTLKIGARVTLGPGVFTTKGYSDDDPGNGAGWTPAPAMKPNPR